MSRWWPSLRVQGTACRRSCRDNCSFTPCSPYHQSKPWLWVDLPAYALQEGGGEALLGLEDGALDGGGIGDLRVGVKWTFFGQVEAGSDPAAAVGPWLPYWRPFRCRLEMAHAFKAKGRA